MKISIVIPLFNEEDGVKELLDRTIVSLRKISEQYEIIAVDDGSSDQTLAHLLKYQSSNSHIKILQLSRNFGHQAAYTAGLEKAIGDYVGLLDGDLQDPPELFIDMYNKLASGKVDIVYGKRTNRVQISHRFILALWFHKFFKKVSGFPDLENVGNFSLMNKKALEALLSFRENIRYLPGLRSFIGFNQDFILYERSDRFKGQSKMGLGKLFTLSSDAIFSFSKIPIKICLYLGITGIIIFFIAGLYTLIAKIAGFALFGWSSTVLSIYFLGSIQLTFLGVLGEYIYRIYKESQRRPLYLVKKIFE
ncbi:MAG: glycosyltransferase family 2 protein [Bacteroidales bacterium]|nr:glycosyltransferase family 2 protein [Bacteroidales bacterium]